jgi:hypothetical protein
MVTRRSVLAAGVAGSGAAIGLRAWRGPGTREARWVQGVPMPFARSELVARVLNGKIYVLGGWDYGERVECFDPAAQTWSAAPSMPFPINHLGAAVLGGRLIVAGGYSSQDFVATELAWSWGPGEPAWSALPSLPSPRGAHGMVTVAGSVYAIGGAYEQLGGPVCGETLRLNLAAQRWEAFAPMPTPREHLAIVAATGRIHAIGGRANGDEGDAFAAAHEVYRPETDRWTAAALLPVPRGGLGGTFGGGRIVVAGGERGDTTYAAANAYDPVGDVWETLPNMPTARHGLGCAFFDGLLYTISGSTLAGGIENSPAVELLWLGGSAD